MIDLIQVLAYIFLSSAIVKKEEKANRVKFILIQKVASGEEGRGGCDKLPWVINRCRLGRVNLEGVVSADCEGIFLCVECLQQMDKIFTIVSYLVKNLSCKVCVH